MRLEERTIGKVLVVKVEESRIGAEVSLTFRKDLKDLLSRVNQNVVVDLSEVTFIDSSGLGALIAGLKLMDGKHELALCGICDTVYSLFKLTRMDRVFQIYLNAEVASAALSKGS